VPGGPWQETKAEEGGMYIYLIQHGEAKAEEEDPGRGLTERGVRDVGRVARYLAGIPVRPFRIYHSGKKRAAETASLFHEALGPSGGMAEADGLSPMDDPGIWYDRLSRDSEQVMLVGHLPHLARLSGMLLAGDKEKAAIGFRMGGVVCLRRPEQGLWLVEWMVVPEVIVWGAPAP
jgi:phosphohistidine phosphatase